MEKNTILHELYRYGQSIWLDNISRPLIESGQLKNLIREGVSGLTSNPSIFEKSIANTTDYDKKIEELFAKSKTAFEVYDELTVKDVQDAADLFFDVYDETDKMDGYVSLEVDPRLSLKKDQTIKECKRLYRKVNRPNVMFKIPATSQGCQAAQELLAEGVSINYTLIFSLEQYEEAAESFLSGVEKYLKKHGKKETIASVASVFVSRIDSVVDKILDEKIKDEINVVKKDRLISLKGKAAVGNSYRIFEKYMGILSSSRFKKLSGMKVMPQRVLWASTSTKNPQYRDIKYIEELIAKKTVNTVPDNTLSAFLDHGLVKETLVINSVKEKQALEDLGAIGVDVGDICRELLKNGLDSFIQSFSSLMAAIENKSKALYRFKNCQIDK